MSALRGGLLKGLFLGALALGQPLLPRPAHAQAQSGDTDTCVAALADYQVGVSTLQAQLGDGPANSGDERSRATAMAVPRKAMDAAATQFQANRCADHSATRRAVALMCEDWAKDLRGRAIDIHTNPDPRNVRTARRTFDALAPEYGRFQCGDPQDLEPPTPVSERQRGAEALAPDVAAEIGRRLDAIEAASPGEDLQLRVGLVAYERSVAGLPPHVLVEALSGLASAQQGSRATEAADNAIRSYQEVLSLTNGDDAEVDQYDQAATQIGWIYDDRKRDVARALGYYRVARAYNAVMSGRAFSADDWARDSFRLLVRRLPTFLKQIGDFEHAAAIQKSEIDYLKGGCRDAEQAYRDSRRKTEPGANPVEQDPMEPIELSNQCHLVTKYVDLSNTLVAQGNPAAANATLDEAEAFQQDLMALIGSEVNGSGRRYGDDATAADLIKARRAEIAASGAPNAAGLKSLEAQLPTDPDARHTALDAIAAGYVGLGDYAAAEARHRQAFATLAGAEDPAAILAMVRDRGRSEAALRAQYADQPVMSQLAPWMVLTRIVGAERDIDRLADDLLAEGRGDEAIRMASLDLQVSQALFPGESDAVVLANNLLAQITFRLGRLREAETYEATAVDILLRNRSLSIQRAADPLNGQNDAGALADQAHVGLENYLQLGWLTREQGGTDGASLNRAFMAAQDLIQSRSAQAMALAAARVASGNGAVSRLVREQQDTVTRLKGLYVELRSAPSENAGALITELDSLQQRLMALDAQLDREFPAYRGLATPLPMPIAEVRQSLAPDEGVLLLVIAKDDAYAFAVSAGGVSWNRLENGAKAVAAHIAELRCEVDREACGAHAEGRPGGSPSPFEAQGYARFDLAAAHDLYASLIQPVESALGGVKRLYVSTSSLLGDLPLGMLVTDTPAPNADGADPAVLQRTPWLSDRYALTVVPAVASLRLKIAAAATPIGATVPFDGYGDPKLSGDGLDRLRGARIFRTVDGVKTALADPAVLRTAPPLPGTRHELEAMATTLSARADAVHLLEAATETAVKTDPHLAEARVIAFATHGVLPVPSAGFEEPGLLLTPPDTPSELDDGLLTASEASQLSLSADWVILSACNTASAAGSDGADGLSSLARGFLYAGAHALLASHWAVADDATAAFTVETLRLRATHADLTRARAVQQAMQEIRSGRRDDGSAIAGWTPRWSHPAAWAPFSVIANHDD